MNFVPLHVYSGYSYLKSALKVSDYVKQAKELGYNVLSLTDFNNLTEAPEFVNTCKKENLKYIIGEDLIVEDKLFTFIVLNEQGYRNLLKLNFASQTNKLNARLIQENNEGLAVILGSNNKEFSNLAVFSKQLPSLAKGIQNFYIGLQRNDEAYMQSIREYCKNFSFDLVAFPMIKYVKASDAIALDMLSAIAKKIVLTDKKKTGIHCILDESQINKIYLKEEIELTQKIANLVNFEFISNRGKMLQYKNELNLTSDEYLRKLSNDRLLEKGLDSEEYHERLDMELDIIISMGYSDYFLVVQDFIAYARNHNIAVGPGRGSAVGSLVSYVLGITQADPIKYNLIFERFLNKQRQTLPDIDVDFADIYREEIVEYLKDKYGENRVAKVIAVQTFGAKAALNDVGRVFNYDEYDIKQFTKLIHEDENGDSATINELYKTNEAFKKLVDEDAYYKQIVLLARRLEGLPRQSSLHAAGIVLNDEPLDSVIPITIDSMGNVVEQFEKDYLEPQQFLKMDLLALRNLTVVDDCIARIKHNRGISLDRDKIPFEDEEAIKLIAQGKTMGLFQIESFGMRKSIKVLKPSKFEDIVALISLYRPGPMDNINKYATRKNGREKFTYLSKALEEILSPTYGIIIYQEQVMQIANKMAGFSFGEADLLRRAIAKKDMNKMASYKDKFIKGAIANKYPQTEANKVWDLIYKFGDYGFNKSHALGYAILTCRMAYLKAHYPQEFYASILTNSNSKWFTTTIAEIKSRNIKIVNPSINESLLWYEQINEKIYFPLTSISGITSKIAEDIIDERKQNGPFTDYCDFVARMYRYKINEKFIMKLIDAGALDCLGVNRVTLRSNMTEALQYASAAEGENGQMFLDLGINMKPDLVEYEDNPVFNLNREFDALGLMLSGSPLSLAKSKIQNKNFVSLEQISNSNGNSLELACIIRDAKIIKTKKGDRMAFLTVYDESYETEFTVFPEAFKVSEKALRKGNMVIVEGYYKQSTDEFNIQKVSSMEDVING